MKLLGKGDKLDRYRGHLLNGDDLDEEQQIMLERYRRASALMCCGYSRMQSITLLKNETALSESQLYNIVRDSIKLFGSVNDVDKAGMKYIMYENFMLAANLARKEGNHDAMIRAYENASRIYDLFTADTHLIDPRHYLRPIAIIYSTDPQVLVDQQTQDLEDQDSYAIEAT